VSASANTQSCGDCQGCGVCSMGQLCNPCPMHNRSTFQGGKAALKAGALGFAILALAAVLLLASGCAGYDTRVAVTYAGMGAEFQVSKPSGKAPVQVQPQK
jgi:hypothetical protein